MPVRKQSGRMIRIEDSTIHYAGVDKADEFFTSLDTLDYDIIGLSYYHMARQKP